jgi:hypothetical protein
MSWEAFRQLQTGDVIKFRRGRSLRLIEDVIRSAPTNKRYPGRVTVVLAGRWGHLVYVGQDQACDWDLIRTNEERLKQIA